MKSSILMRDHAADNTRNIPRHRQCHGNPNYVPAGKDAVAAAQASTRLSHSTAGTSFCLRLIEVGIEAPVVAGTGESRPGPSHPV